MLTDLLWHLHIVEVDERLIRLRLGLQELLQLRNISISIALGEAVRAKRVVWICFKELASQPIDDCGLVCYIHTLPP